MSSLSSTSTYAQIKACYLDSAGYAEDNSVPKANAFVTACRALMLNPSKSAHGKGGSIEFDLQVLQQQLNEARAWIASHGSPGVVHSSFGNFRDYPPGSAWPYPCYP